MTTKTEERQPLLSATSDNAATTSADITDTTTDSSSYVPIEPMLFGYTFARIVLNVLSTLYFFDQASHMYGDPSMDSLKPCGSNHSGHPDKAKAENVQKEYVQLCMIAALSSFITAIIPTVFLGPTIDVKGRRIGFVLPLLGIIVRGIVTLIVIGTGMSVYYIYIGTVLEGLSGGFGTFFMTTFSSAADITRPGRQRSLRICIIEAVQVLGSSSAALAAGQWRRLSYTHPLIFAISIAIVSFIYALWFWPETKQLPRGGSSQVKRAGRSENITGGTASNGLATCGNNHLTEDLTYRTDVGSNNIQDGYFRSGYQSFSQQLGKHSADFDSQGRPAGRVMSNGRPRPISTSCSSDSDPYKSTGDSDVGRPTSSSSACYFIGLSNIRNSWRVYFLADVTSHPARRCVLALCFFSFILTVAVNFSKPSIETAFRMSDLCWDAVKETEFDSGWLVQHWVFILILLHLLQHRLHSVYLAMIGCLSGLLAVFIFSVATWPTISDKTSNILVFVSAGSGTFARFLIPMLRSMSSSVISLDEQGAMFTSYACVELAGAAVFDLAATQIYRATIHVWKGIIFAIMTFLFVIIMLLLIILSRFLKRRPATDLETNVATENRSIN